MGDPEASDAYLDVESRLLARWPETRLEPSLVRIAALCDLMGQPQRAYPVVHLTGTNGKTSTARMIDTLLRGLGLRTGRSTSPHVESMTERISIDGSPLSRERFVEVYDEVEPYAAIVDNSGPFPVSFFEFITAMSFAAFADAPVDAGIIEVGMGGVWDATNVADAAVAVVTPIAVDHSSYLGDMPAEIAVEKAGIIKPGSFAILGQQPLEAAEVLLAHAAQVGATVAREGLEFGVTSRTPGLGGQVVTIQGLEATYEDVFLPLHGAHQANNAACAIAAVEAFAGGTGLDGGLDIEAVREAMEQVDSPGRLEVVRRSPTVVIDAAHNPAGAIATAEAVQEAFSFSPLIGVLGVMADKDVDGLLDAFEPVFATVVCTQNSTPRAMRAESLGELARGVFGSDRVIVAPRLGDAVVQAIGLAEEGEGGGLGGGGVLITGSVITAGEARSLLWRPGLTG
ncbi:MAG TPA: folylpolyglutamate synthase/dihydrofolate synthase family protein [Nocardioidaceae bacterium]|nr:folylpolyglutamate synthase/dihydrofolate synthase family protein [Nocardioidaceae bacterium]